jgi:hypothetical protein
MGALQIEWLAWSRGTLVLYAKAGWWYRLRDGKDKAQIKSFEDFIPSRLYAYPDTVSP